MCEGDTGEKEAGRDGFCILIGWKRGRWIGTLTRM